MKKCFKLLPIILLSTIILKGDTKPTEQSNEVWVNIFIHGIIKPIVNLGDVIKIADQKLKQTRYKYVTKYIRKNHVMHRGQAMQEVGLHQVKMQPNPNNNGSRALVSVFKKLKEYTGQAHEKELYYTFGWSGLLSYKSRQKAAHFLYNKLLRLTEGIRQKGLEPRIRIISFSHGGNVAMQLGNIDPWNKRELKLPIAELITLGMPIHKENDVLVRHPMFEKIYHFYSDGDMAQKVDFLSTDYTSSHRRYAPRKCFSIPKKLTQVQVQFSKTVRHKHPFTPANKYGIATFDPNHIEMWSFGWTPRGYNQQSPIYPLPTAALVPYLADIIEETKGLGTNLVAEIHPDKEKITFTDRRWSDHHKIQEVVVPFLTNQEFKDIKLSAWARRPKNHTIESLHKVVNNAIKFATRQRKLLKHCSKTLDCPMSNCVAKSSQQI